MPRPCRVGEVGGCGPGQSTRVPSAASLRHFSASPETHRRLSPELRGEILQAPGPTRRCNRRYGSPSLLPAARLTFVVTTDLCRYARRAL
jgi:hypothetical protein